LSWFIGQGEEEFNKIKEECNAKIKLFGPLAFGERHHPWIRHITIEAWIHGNGCPLFHFRSLTDQYEDIELERYEMVHEGIMGSKEMLEDHLAKRFLDDQYMGPTTYTSSDKHDIKTRYRLALYLNYKFHKALNKKE
jgi:hypothetical protein